MVTIDVSPQRLVRDMTLMWLAERGVSTETALKNARRAFAAGNEFASWAWLLRWAGAPRERSNFEWLAGIDLGLEEQPTGSIKMSWDDFFNAATRSSSLPCPESEYVRVPVKELGLDGRSFAMYCLSQTQDLR